LTVAAASVLSGAAAVAVALLVLAGCVGPDREQLRLCRSAVPALEPEGTIRVKASGPDPATSAVMRVAYSVELDGAVRHGTLRCAFAGGRLDFSRLELVAAEKDGVPLGEARLLFLKRFWLADREATAEGDRRIADPGEPPLLPVGVGRDVGYFLQQLVNALPIGSIYGLLAMAYALFYGLVGRINLAYGQFAIIGAFTLVNVVSIAVIASPGMAGSSIVVTAVAALAAAAGVTAVAGGVVGRLVFDPLSSANHRSFLIATIGLAVAMSEAMRIASRSRDAWLQPMLNDPILLAGGGYRVTVTGMQLLEVGVAVVLVAVVAWLLAQTAFGRAWRAVADDPLMARFLGIDPLATAAATILISSALAGAAGAITTLHYGHASASSGLLIGLKALVAAILGGIGSVPGAAAGGLFIGLADTLWAAYLPFDQRDIFVLSLLVLVLVFRPNGLFGRERPAADSSEVRWQKAG
jgi:branched-chain amino acid transport system permease protein